MLPCGFNRIHSSIVFGILVTVVGPGVGSALAEPERTVEEKQLKAWWVDLEKEELQASRALLQFADRPKQTVAYLAKQMKPLQLSAERLRKLLDDLLSDEKAVWKPAFEELEYFDPRLAIDLETLMREENLTPTRSRLVEVLCGREADSLKGQAINLRGIGGGNFNFSAGGGSWWAEHRIERINSLPFNNIKKKWTRAVRAIVLLEHIGSPEAVIILKSMATGHPEAQPTRAAKEAVARLDAGGAKAAGK